MKALFLVQLFTIFGSILTAQPEIATWKIDAKDTGNNTVELRFTGAIEQGWHVYSIQQTDGPLPASVSITKTADFTLDGELQEGLASKEKFDQVFEMNVNYYKDKAVFVQRLKRIGDNGFTVRGTLSYQGCSDNQCIPVDHDFSVKVAPLAPADPVQSGSSAEAGAASAQDGVADENQQDTLLSSVGNSSTDESSPSISNAAESAPADAGEESILMFILMAIGFGLLAILTPCVFPMIPMTVSFFISGSSGRAATLIKALVFFISVGLIYGLIGVVVAVFKNPAIANIISSHYAPNLIFAAMFIIFAISFMGAFEIILPTGLANRADRQVDKGGYAASFFMAVALAIVSFSCTGPFVGALLPAAASGVSVWKPVLGLFCFGLAMASPFLTVAIFPSLMKKLKSGGWLNSVKVVFAFVMLGFCVKFLAVADLSLGWNLLTRDVAIAFWIVLSIMLGLYLLGKIRFSHDSPVDKIGVGRFSLAAAAFVFALYLLPGMFGADLDAVSAFLPAKDRQSFSISAASETKASAATATKLGTCGNTPLYANTRMHTPAGIQGYFDMQEAIECARSLNRPIFIDFTGHSCANCKRMEASTLKDSRIVELMNNEFVWLSLFYDDDEALPADQQTNAYQTVGKRNRAYMLKTFATVASPYFAIIDSDGKIHAQGLGLEENADKFLGFAREGLQSFRNTVVIQ